MLVANTGNKMGEELVEAVGKGPHKYRNECFVTIIVKSRRTAIGMAS